MEQKYAPALTPSPLNLVKPEQSLSGFAYALGAYFCWGFLPLYMKSLDALSPVEVVAHRVIWSVPIALLVLWFGRQTADLRAAFTSPKVVLMGIICATLISLNWGIYIWAVHAGRTLDAALGYYINPLFSILLGTVLLGERPKGLQWAAIGAVFIGGGILTYEAGSLPLPALGMMMTWGFYAYFKRSLPIAANVGFALEVVLILPVALGLLVYFATKDEMVFLHGPVWQDLMILGLGVITSVPLLLYANGAKQLSLSTIAIMQYIAPTMIFLSAVFILGEAFSQTKLIAFSFIWLAMVLYLSTMFKRS